MIPQAKSSFCLKLFSFVLLFFLLFGAWPCFADEELAATMAVKRDVNVLIFSPSHGPVSYVEKPGLVQFQVAISSFFPILEVRINNRPVQLSQDSEVSFTYPLPINQPKTQLVVQARTSQGWGQKKFDFILGKEEDQGAGKLQVIGIGKLSYLDNLTSAQVGSDKVGAGKFTLTLVPIYSLQLAPDQKLSLKGVILREKVNHTDYSDKETAFTQLTTEWQQTLGEDYIQFSLGADDIRTSSKQPWLGTDKLMKEGFVGAEYKAALNKKENWTTSLEYKVKDYEAVSSDEDDETDAVESSVKLALRLELWALLWDAKTKYALNNAQGKYQDSTTLEAGLKAGWKEELWSASWAYDISQTQKAIYKPSVDARQKDLSGTTTLMGGYQWFPKIKLDVTLKAKKQNSNVESSNYEANTLSLGWTQIF